MAAVVSSYRLQELHERQFPGEADDGDGEGAGSAKDGVRHVNVAGGASGTHIAVGEWTAEEVGAWLEGRVGDAVAAAAATAGVSGRMLGKMSAAAWAELGVLSALDQVRLMADIEAAVEDGAPPPGRGQGGSWVAGGGRVPGKQYPTDPERFPSWGELAKHNAYWALRTPDGGAEHTRGWVVSMANAYRNPSHLKQHVLRFLGMYNVIDLLTFTVNISFMITMEAKGKGPDNWSSLLALFVLGVASSMSGFACVGSCMFYNTCSSVADVNFTAFCKTPAVIHMLKFVNDASIWSGFMTFFFGPLILMYRCLVDLAPGEWVLYPGAEPTLVHWAYLVPVLAVTILYSILFLQPQVLCGVLMGTHLAMYGGLMADRPIAPLAEDPAWAHRSTPEEVEAWIRAESERVGSAENPRECEAQAATAYAVDTVARIDAELLDASGTLDAAAVLGVDAKLVSTLAAAIGEAGRSGGSVRAPLRTASSRSDPGAGLAPL